MDIRWARGTSRWILLVGLAVLMPPAAAAEEECPSELGRWGSPFISAATATEGRVVVVDRTAGLRVFATSETHPLEEVGLLPELGTSEELASSGDTVVAVTGNNLYVVSIANPSDPRQIGSRLPSSSVEVAMSGSFAFSNVTSGAAESLRAIDLSDPFEPSLATVIPLNDTEGDRMVFVSDIAAHGSLLIVVGETEPHVCNFFDEWWEGEYALLTFDISRPAAPRLLGSVNLGCEWVSSVATTGRWAYAVHPTPNTSRLQIVDLIRPASPSIAVDSSSMLPRDCWFLAAYGGRLLVGQRDEGSGIQHVYELGHPLRPRHVGSFVGSGLVFGPALVGERAFVPFGESGLVVLDLATCPAASPPSPRHPTRRAMPGTPGGAAEPATPSCALGEARR